MARHVSLAGGVALLLMASAAVAQPPGGGRGFGGGFGRGMGPQSGVMLLGMEEVRKELGTTEEQNKEIQQIQDDLRNSAGGFQGFRDLSESERQKRIDEMRKKGEEADAKLAKVLKPEQLDRLNQLRLQREGVIALTRADVADKLGLSQEQKDKIKKIQDEARPQGGFDFQNASEEERREYRQKMQEQREKAEADTLAVLTADQKSKFTEMKGKEFQFPQRGGFGQGGGNRPRTRPRN